MAEVTNIAAPTGAAPAVQPGEGAAPAKHPANPAGGPGTLPGAPAPGQSGPVRGPDGRFAPTGGETPSEAQQRRWKFGEEEFDAPETALERAHALLKAQTEEAKAFKGMTERAFRTESEAKALKERLEKDPEAFLREKGWDPIKAGQKAFLDELEKRKKFAGVPEEFRGILEEHESLKAKTAEFEAKEKARAEQETRDKEAAEWKTEQSELVTVIQSAWEGLNLPQTPFLLGLAAEEWRAQKLAGMKPNPTLVARAIRETVSELQSVLDSDERFNAADYIKRHPKRAEAIRAEALRAANIPLTPNSGRPITTENSKKEDAVDASNRVWNLSRR